MSPQIVLLVKTVILVEVSSLIPVHFDEASFSRNALPSSTLPVSSTAITPTSETNVSSPANPIVNPSTSTLPNATIIVNTTFSPTLPSLVPSTNSSSSPSPSQNATSATSITAASGVNVTNTTVSSPSTTSPTIVNITSPSTTTAPSTSNQTSLTTTTSTVNATFPPIPTTPPMPMNGTPSPPAVISVSPFPPTPPLTPAGTVAVTPTRTTTPAPTPSTSTTPAVVNATSKCELGDDILHILYNRTTSNHTAYGVEQSVGIVGTRAEILMALGNVTRNYTRQQIEACLDQYVVPERPVGQPDSSAASHLSYARPSHLGVVPTVPVPKPPSNNFEYGHGYSTYLSPFRIAERVPSFRPNRYQLANSIQDIFVTAVRDFQRDWNTLFTYGQPAYWFDASTALANSTGYLSVEPISKHSWNVLKQAHHKTRSTYLRVDSNRQFNGSQDFKNRSL